MGYASCLEDNTDRVHDNWHMRGGGYRYQPEPQSKSVFVAASPPLQPTISQVVILPPPRPAPEAIVERERALHEKHILALYELKPGRRWRH
jgi:hypothetical protein